MNTVKNEIIDSTSTNDEGRWLFNVSFDTEGHHRIQAQFLGDDDYTPVSTKEYTIAIGVLPYFGCDERGNVLTSPNRKIEGFVFECPEDGMAESITAYIQAGWALGQMRCAIYDYDDYTLVGETEERTFEEGKRFFEWRTFVFLSPRPKLTKGKKYILALWGSGAVVIYMFFGGEPQQRLTQIKSYTGHFPSIFKPMYRRDFNCSVYCSYTPTEEPPKNWNLNIYSTPISVPVTLDGLDIGDTPLSKIVSEGTHTVSVPSIIAEDDVEYNFKQWENGSTSPSRIINIISDTTITAEYEEVTPQPRELTIKSEPINVEVTLNSELIGDTPVTVTVEEGSHIVSVPDTVEETSGKYGFISWEDGSTSATRTVEVLSDTTIIATYEEIVPSLYTLTVQPNINGITSPPSGIHEYVEGTEVEVTAYPNEGYQFDYWEIDGVKETSNPVIILMDKNYTILAIFSEIPVPPVEDKIVLSIISKDTGEVLKVTIPCKIED